MEVDENQQQQKQEQQQEQKDKSQQEQQQQDQGDADAKQEEQEQSQQQEQEQQQQGRPHSYTASQELMKQLATSGRRVLYWGLYYTHSKFGYHVVLSPYHTLCWVHPWQKAPEGVRNGLLQSS